MKRIISIIILIVSLSCITIFTIFTLMNKGVKKEVKPNIVKTVLKVSSNISNNILSEIYNIYLNNEKYKVKVEYILNPKDDEKTYNVDLIIYLDGNKVLEQNVLTSVNASLEEITSDEEVMDIIGFEENSFKILKSSKDYLLVNVGYKKDSVLKKYFIIDDNGKILNENGILVFDGSKIYNFSNLEHYIEDDNMYLAKISNNEIFALEEKIEKKKIKLEEYKYYISEGKLKKELINTYENVEVNK